MFLAWETSHDATVSWNKKKKVNVLISAHQDGQLLSNTVKHFKIDTIVGSSSKGVPWLLEIF